MKILILTCNTGEGHNQTAKSIIDEFTALGHECNAVDSLNFLSEKVVYVNYFSHFYSENQLNTYN